MLPAAQFGDLERIRDWVLLIHAPATLLPVMGLALLGFRRAPFAAVVAVVFTLVVSLIGTGSRGPVLAAGGLDAAGAEIRRLVLERAPSLVVIDGVHALRNAADDRLGYQRFIHELETHAAVTGLTTLLLAHPPEGAIAADPTFTIAEAERRISRCKADITARSDALRRQRASGCRRCTRRAPGTSRSPTPG